MEHIAQGSSYEYTPLDPTKVRLIRLLPRNGTESINVIKCTVHHASLADPTCQYDAFVL